MPPFSSVNYVNPNPTDYNEQEGRFYEKQLYAACCQVWSSDTGWKYFSHHEVAVDVPTAFRQALDSICKEFTECKGYVGHRVLTVHPIPDSDIRSMGYHR